MKKTPGFISVLPLIVILLYGITLTAQTATQTLIYGKVTGTDGDALFGVYVIADGLGTGTITDVNGEYKFAVRHTGELRLIFSMVGYRRVSHTVDINVSVMDQIRQDAVLETITLSSGEIVVTAGRRSQITGSVPISMRVVGSAEIQRRNALSLDQTLRYIPGVQITENQVGIRGSTGFSYGTGSRVLMMVDGAPLMGPDQSDVRFHAVPMSRVERIETIKGPGSALYGSGALGGVINLITMDPGPEPETIVRGWLSGYQPVYYEEWKENWDGADRWRTLNGLSITHSQALTDRFALWVHGMGRFDQNYLERASNNSLQTYSKLVYRASSDLTLRTFIGYRISRHHTFLYWNGLNDPLSLGRIQLGNQSATGGSYVEGQQLTVLPTLQHILSSNLSYTIRGRVYGIYSKPLDVQTGKASPKHHHTRGMRYGSEAEFTWLPLAGTVLIAGISGDGIVADANLLIGQDNQRVRNQPEYAAFGQLDMRLLRQLGVVAGLRYDAYHIDTKDIASKLSPKLNLSWTLNESAVVRVAYGLGFRVPSVSERFVNNSDYLPLSPNLNLRPETSMGLEAGLRWTGRLGDDIMIDTDIVVFHNEYKDLIEPQFLPEFASFMFINLTEARITGLEVTVDLRAIQGRLGSMLGYTYLDHKDTGNDLSLPYRSDHQISFAVDYSLGSGISLGLDYRYLSKPSRIDTDFSIFVPGADEFVDISVADARLNWDLPSNVLAGKLDNARISLLVHNMLNYYYVERPAYLARPRSFEINMILSF
jgi:outer membrane receptor for ferrienterochelin and colicins